MQPIWLTIWLMLSAVAIAAPVGIAIALSAACCGTGRLGRCVRGCFVVSLLCAVALPLYLHAAGWESAAGKFGWISLLQTTGQRYWFTGFVATAWIHGISGAAWVGLGTAWGLARLPSNIFDMVSLEAGWVGGLRAVALPLAWPAIAAAALWVALLGATEMTVADLYGVRTLADLVYLRYAFDPEPLWIGLACLTPAVVAIPLLFLVVHLRRRVDLIEGERPGSWFTLIASPGVSSRRHPTTSSWAEKAKRSLSSRGPFSASGVGGARRAVAFTLVALGVVAILVVPLFSLLVKAGWQVVEDGGQAVGEPLRYGWSSTRFAATVGEAFRTFGSEYRWTAVLALSTAIPAVLFAWLAAAWAERSVLISRIAIGAALLLVLLPGPVVGMLVVRVFHGHGPLVGWLYTQTLIPTVCSQLFRAGPAAYLVVRAGYRLLDRRVTDAARSDGANLCNQLFRVDAPQLWGTLSAAGLVAALVTTADVPASLVVLPPSVSTVGTRVFGLLHSGVRYQEAGLAIGFCFGFASLLVLAGAAVAFRHRITPSRFL